MRLTEMTIRALKGSESYKTYFDHTVPGFGVRVGKRAKTYVVVRGRSRERITIGKFDDLKLADARTEAKRLLASAEARQPSVAFREAREAFLERYSNPRTAYQVKHALERHFKALDAMLLCDITHQDIERCLARIADFLDSAKDVVRYFKNERFGFSVTYYESNRARQYFPDFIVATTDSVGREVMWLAETKGEVRPNTALKSEAARLWCEKMTGTQYGEWRYLFVPQRKLEAALVGGVGSLAEFAARM